MSKYYVFERRILQIPVEKVGDWKPGPKYCSQYREELQIEAICLVRAIDKHLSTLMSTKQTFSNFNHDPEAKRVFVIKLFF